MTEKHTSKGKTQPWRILLSDKEEAHDICKLTDRPWARQILADASSNLVNEERQHRHPEYDKYRKPDPFQGIYKAESSTGGGRDRFRRTDGTGISVEKLADLLHQLRGKD
ncbi:unnamed protein product [Clonostachys rosea]|uniref:Uncharacterized protein n=1 Tax=Bionectria ochroleuca TaxID=29856 RepID=A0ABY6UPM4_BIOOC|nr:unnamed protein product [Clonostachys rosea]